jgi:hypothetical protein
MSSGTEDKQSFHYQGFSSPNGTIVPDDVFDLLLPHLSDIELRVLLYIIRRTFGFKKEHDDISLKQIVEGIRTQDGRTLDRGAGVSKPSAIKAVRGLSEKGIITAQRNSSPARGDEPTTYALRFREGPVLTALTRGGKRDLPGRVNAIDPQQTGIQQTVRQQTDPSSNYLEGDTTHKRDEKSHSSKKREVRKFEGSEGEDATEQEEDGRDQGDYGPITPSRDGPSSVGQILKARKLAPRSPKMGPGAAEQGRSGPRRQARRMRPESTPYIEALITQFSSEFHDEHALDSNLGQAARLYQASGLADEQFVARLYEARSITKDRGNITKPAKGQAGELGLRNRGAYYFKVLRDLLGMKEERGVRG